MRVLIAGLVCLAMTGVALADEKKTNEKELAKLIGTAWTHEVEGMELTFKFLKEGKGKVVVTVGENGITVGVDYTVAADSTITIKVTELEEKGSFPGGGPAKGTEFKFRLAIDDKMATLSDFSGEGSDEAKRFVEGDYKKVEEKKKAKEKK